MYFVRKHPHKRGAAPKTGVAAATRLPGSSRPTSTTFPLSPTEADAARGRRAAAASVARQHPPCRGGSRHAIWRQPPGRTAASAAGWRQPARLLLSKAYLSLLYPHSWLPLQTRCTCRNSRGGAPRVCLERGAGLSPCARGTPSVCKSQFLANGAMANDE